jgi:hypothetical protein
VRCFSLVQFIPRADYPDQEEVKHYHEKPILFDIYTKGGLQQSASLAFADRPQDAPILHIDGPCQLEVMDKFGPAVFRRGESSELYVRLITPGLKANVTASPIEFPTDIHPVAEIEFPPERPGAEPIRQRVVLKERC